ncbi:unnamed protein product [Anisakis simplex]|uniref:Homeobox domain-containing protein n=1 Tax=Anisakis simplex TaxID=6269 RepID=A0A0M3K2X0_ANISI|nr:unnamed protein product [Anisakis simplex]
MNMLDPRQLFINPFAYNIDPSTIALLGTPPGAQNSAAGKMNLSNSFRISNILESSEEKANTSGEHESSSVGEEERSGSAESHRSVTSPQSSANGGKKARKARTIFTDKQLQELEATFDKQKYLSVQDRMDLAQRMGLSDTQVKTWYQNRRTKWKRQAAVGMDLLNEASNVAAVQQLLRTNPYWANYMAANSFTHPRLFSFGGGMNSVNATTLQGALSMNALQAAAAASSMPIPSPLTAPMPPAMPSSNMAIISSSTPSTTTTTSTSSPTPTSATTPTNFSLTMFPFQIPPNNAFAINLPHSPSNPLLKKPSNTDHREEIN